MDQACTDSDDDFGNISVIVGDSNFLDGSETSNAGLALEDDVGIDMNFSDIKDAEHDLSLLGLETGNDPMEDEKIPDPKQEPKEADPPLLAIQGFRPADYSASDFVVGTRIRWAMSKTDSWNDGIVTGNLIDPPNSQCTLFVTRLGNHPPGTFTELQFPGT